MLAGGKAGGHAAVLCGLVCLACPIAISSLTMAFGADEWLYDDEPVPVATHVIDALFLADLGSTVVLLLLLGGRWRLTVAIAALPLLCLTGVLAFWGGLWVSGQWL